METKTMTCEEYERLMELPHEEFAKHIFACAQHVRDCEAHAMPSDVFDVHEREIRPYIEGDASRGILPNDERMRRLWAAIAKLDEAATEPEVPK